MIILSAFWYVTFSSYLVSNDIPLRRFEQYHASQARLCYQMHFEKRPLEYFATDWEMIYSLRDVWKLECDTIKNALNAHPDVYILFIAGFKPDYLVLLWDVIEILVSTLTFSQLCQLSTRINRVSNGHESYLLLAARALEKGILPESVVSFETAESIIQKLNWQTQHGTGTNIKETPKSEATKLPPIN